MTDEDRKDPSSERINAERRMRFIGFEVFPGKTKDLFKNEAEKDDYVDGVRSRRSGGAIVRDDCKLLEERISAKERIVLTVASVVVVLALFLPWYSAYTEITEEADTSESGMLADTVTMSSDSTFSAVADSDTVAALASVEGEPADDEPDDTLLSDVSSSAPAEEIITHHRARARVHREYHRLSGIGSFAALGSVGSHVFSSGVVLALTGVVFLVCSILCLVLPALTLYCLFGLKGDEEGVTVKLKKYLRLNWLPVALFAIALVMSFFGAEYAHSTVGTYTSIGDSYGPGVFLGTLSWGVPVSMAAFILIAVKGIEV